MGRKLYVGNLPYSVDDAALAEIFKQAGDVVSASIVKDHETGRARGFGFVEMKTDEEAEKAIRLLNEKDLGGRPLAVNEARPRERRGPGDGRGPGGGSFTPRPPDGGAARRFQAPLDGEPPPFEGIDRFERGSRRVPGAKREKEARRESTDVGRRGRPGRGRGPGRRSRNPESYDDE